MVNVHTWTAVFLWHIFMASLWACTEPSSGPFLRACILLPHPTRCITVYDNVQVSPQRLLLSGWLLTNVLVQVNITTAIYDTGHTLMYVTLQLLFMVFFTHLSSSWAGWLSSIPFVRYIYMLISIECSIKIKITIITLFHIMISLLFH
jgi:hypothetical protein